MRIERINLTPCFSLNVRTLTPPRPFRWTIRARDSATLTCNVAQLIASAGEERALRNLARLGGDTLENKRWLAYGHFLAGRADELATALAALPANDGWTIAMQTYLALAAGDEDAAQGWYDKLKTSSLPPQDYIPELDKAFSEASQAVVVYDFNWPDGVLFKMVGRPISLALVSNAWSMPAPSCSVACRRRIMLWRWHGCCARAGLCAACRSSATPAKWPVPKVASLF